VPRWLELLTPNELADSIADIDLASLRARGITTLICDLDNTLVFWRKPDMNPSVRAWLERAKEQGFDLALVSNNQTGRVARVADELGIPAVPNAAKPRRRGFRRVLSLLGGEPQHTAVIGDQLFTDILGGNRLGAYTILVVPLAGREFIWTRFIRCLERCVLRRLRQEGLVDGSSEEEE